MRSAATSKRSLVTCSPAGPQHRRHLLQGAALFYQWLEEEDEIATNPTAKLRPPIVPEQPVPVVPEEGLRRCWALAPARASTTRLTEWGLVLMLRRRGAQSPGGSSGLPRRLLLLGVDLGAHREVPRTATNDRYRPAQRRTR